MLRMECMTETEEVRVIFYLTECFETRKVVIMFPILIKKKSAVGYELIFPEVT